MDGIRSVDTPRLRGRPWRRGVVAVAVVVGLSVVGGAAGWAASVATSPGVVAAGRAVTPTCDPAPTWSYAFGTDVHGRVTSVTVTGIAATCAGGGLAVSAGDGSGTPSVGRTATLACSATCSATVPLTQPLRFPSQITVVRAVVTAP